LLKEFSWSTAVDVPKTNLRLKDMLERLANRTQKPYIHSYEFRSGQKKGHIGQSPGKISASFQVLPPSGVIRRHLSLQQKYVKKGCEVLPT
jgi:hypothetical protein